ncbi:hypothetical protein PR048_014841 [Dryococelus australis]|uniref:Uncharacterized protein n=1 Tax=Dryococelus australis TaxID=614101 RepID=A0ABQ9HFB2_9NEOP|nr:hypothetical protein PR048_014841 [Dryococelus australis]
MEQRLNAAVEKKRENPQASGSVHHVSDIGKIGFDTAAPGIYPSLPCETIAENLRTQSEVAQCLTTGLALTGETGFDSRSGRPDFGFPMFSPKSLQMNAGTGYYSPPTKENRARFRMGSPPNFRMWGSCQTMPLVGGFSRGSPVSPTLTLQRYSIPRFTLIGSQDLDLAGGSTCDEVDGRRLAEVKNCCTGCARRRGWWPVDEGVRGLIRREPSRAEPTASVADRWERTRGVERAPAVGVLLVCGVQERGATSSRRARGGGRRACACVRVRVACSSCVATPRDGRANQRGVPLRRRRRTRGLALRLRPAACNNIPKQEREAGALVNDCARWAAQGSGVYVPRRDLRETLMAGGGGARWSPIGYYLYTCPKIDSVHHSGDGGMGQEKGGEYGAVPEVKGVEMGDPRENPPTSSIIRQDTHVRNSGVNRPEIEPVSPWWEASSLIAQPPDESSGSETKKRVEDLAVACRKESFHYSSGAISENHDQDGWASLKVIIETLRSVQCNFVEHSSRLCASNVVDTLSLDYNLEEDPGVSVGFIVTHRTKSVHRVDEILGRYSNYITTEREDRCMRTNGSGLPCRNIITG